MSVFRSINYIYACLFLVSIESTGTVLKRYPTTIKCALVSWHLSLPFALCPHPHPNEAVITEKYKHAHFVKSIHVFGEKCVCDWWQVCMLS